MTTDLVPASLDSRITYAKALAASDLLPKQYRDKPANVLVALEYGAAIGLSPMAAIQGIHVVEGKPTASSQLIGGLVRTAGHRLRVTGDDIHAVAVIVRADDPDFEFRAEWTLERAKNAGLTGKTVWKQYPAAMLKARCITEVARDACPEVLSGVSYTVEELDGARTTVDTTRLAPTTAHVDEPRVRDIGGTPVDTSTGEIDPQEIIDAEVVDEPAEAQPAEAASEGLISAAQMKKLHATLRDLGVADRDSGLTMISDICGEPVESTKALTREQASMVIDTLTQMGRQS